MSDTDKLPADMLFELITSMKRTTQHKTFVTPSTLEWFYRQETIREKSLITRPLSELTREEKVFLKKRGWFDTTPPQSEPGGDN